PPRARRISALQSFSSSLRVSRVSTVHSAGSTRPARPEGPALRRTGAIRRTCRSRRPPPAEARSQRKPFPVASGTAPPGPFGLETRKEALDAGNGIRVVDDNRDLAPEIEADRRNRQRADDGQTIVDEHDFSVRLERA